MKWSDERACKNCEQPFTPESPHHGKSLFCTYSCRERYYHRITNEKRRQRREAASAAALESATSVG